MPSTEQALERALAKKVRRLSSDYKRLLTARLMNLTEKTSVRIVNDAWSYVTNLEVLPEKLVRGTRVANFTPVTKLLGKSVYQGIKDLGKVSDLLNVYRFLVVLVAEILRVRIPRSTVKAKPISSGFPARTPRPRKAKALLDKDGVLRLNAYKSSLAGLTAREKKLQRRRETNAERKALRNARQADRRTGPRTRRVDRVTWKAMVGDLRDRTLRSRVRRAQEMFEAYNKPNDKFQAVGRVDYASITVEYRKVKRLREDVQNLRRSRASAITERELAAIESSIARKVKRISALNKRIDTLATKVRFKEVKAKRRRKASRR